MTHAKDITGILFPLVERWKTIARTTPVVRKDLPGASSEWCFSPRTEDERALMEMLETWDRMEDSILPDLAGTPPPETGGVSRDLAHYPSQTRP